MKELDGSNRKVEIAHGGYTLRTPGLVGTIKEIDRDIGTRSAHAGRKEDLFDDVMKNTDVNLLKVFELKIERDTSPPKIDGIRTDDLTAETTYGEPAMVFEMPYLGDESGVAVLYISEAGIPRWIFPEFAKSGTSPVRGGEGGLVFHLPRTSDTIPDDKAEKDGTRSLFSTLGRRSVRVSQWATGGLVKLGVKAAVKAWEDKQRPYGLHMVTFDSPIDKGGDIDWDFLREGRSLLMIHGTFSTANAAFGALAGDPLRELVNTYDGRVLAFEHPTLHESPVDNVNWLLEKLPDGLDLDIITHSRGGLVARELVLTVDRNRRDIKFNKVVLVAAPLQGTIITDDKHMVQFLDRFTCLLEYLPDTVVTTILEGILTLVKLVGCAGLNVLPGLQAMDPGGAYIKGFKEDPASPFPVSYALASDFQPADQNLLRFLAKRAGDAIIDRIFGAPNDCIVPTEGAHEAAGLTFKDDLVFGHDAQVHHLNYFSDRVAQDKILEWFK